MYTSYSGKDRTNSNIAWHRPQSTTSRVEDELMEKSTRALASTTDPLERLRLLCLSRGAAGIMALGRFFRTMDGDGSKRLSKREFVRAMENTGLDISREDTEKLFDRFDPDDSGFMRVDDFIKQLRPPMSETRQSIVKKAFKKLDKDEHGFIAIEHLRDTYSVTANPRYMSGEDSGSTTMTALLACFETEGTVDGNMTFEDFMNYYSGISVSIDNDGYFDLMMRQAYKL